MCSLSYSTRPQRRSFVAANIAFPSSLAGMTFIFTGLLALEAVSAKTAAKALSLLAPGAAVFSK